MFTKILVSFLFLTASTVSYAANSRVERSVEREGRRGVVGSTQASKIGTEIKRAEFVEALVEQSSDADKAVAIRVQDIVNNEAAMQFSPDQLAGWRNFMTRVYETSNREGLDIRTTASRFVSEAGVTKEEFLEQCDIGKHCGEIFGH